ncbi:DUF6281 family protein [Streptomyces yanii]|uniref:DUF6281 family protein n=1 Tax=Streptomyces yanii TaxID=78510 RepID=A0ABV5RPL8_9ACTN
MRVALSLPRDADRSARSRLLPLSSVIVMVGVVLTAACTTEGQANGSCAFIATYEGRTYTDVSGHIDFTVGNTLGTAEFPPCNDTPNDGDPELPEPTTAYAVDGVDPRSAIAVGSTPDDVTLVAVQRPDDSLPPEVEALIRH